MKEKKEQKIKTKENEMALDVGAKLNWKKGKGKQGEGECKKKEIITKVK